jgi:hypothetical protein
MSFLSADLKTEKRSSLVRSDCLSHDSLNIFSLKRIFVKPTSANPRIVGQPFDAPGKSAAQSFPILFSEIGGFLVQFQQS